MHNVRRPAIVILAALAILGGVLWLTMVRLPSNSGDDRREVKPVAPPESRQSLPDVMTTPGSKAGKGQAPVTFEEWSTAIESMPPEDRGTALVNFLESGNDGATGSPFRVGFGGNLATAPTWRVAALDWLGQTNPSMASEYAQTILASPDSPDEWAVALRNYGRSLEAPADDRYFTARLEELLEIRGWREAPTAGYLEAFDAVVYAATPDLVRKLGELRESSASAATVRAAHMALDAIARGEPEMVATVVVDDARFLEEDVSFRIAIVARLDGSVPAQRSLLERFLLSEQMTPASWRLFAKLYPNANSTGGHFLLTNPSASDLSLLATRDLEAWKMVREWRRDLRFGFHDRALQQLEANLEQWVRAAVSAGRLADSALKPASP